MFFVLPGLLVIFGGFLALRHPPESPQGGQEGQLSESVPPEVILASFGGHVGLLLGTLFGSFSALCRPRRPPETVFPGLFWLRVLDVVLGGQNCSKRACLGRPNVVKVG